MPSDEKKIKWGIIGASARIARNALIPAIKDSTKGSLLALASRNKEKAQKIADEFGVERAYGSYQALLDDEEVDAIYNPLPNSLHCEWTIRAAEKGKHVLCEKPLSCTVKEAEEMIEACKENNVLLMEAFMYRFHPQNAKVKELVTSGFIGSVQLVKASFTFSLSDLGNIRLRKDLGGGAIMDVGCYCINVSRFIMGAEPEEVYATAYFGQESEVDEIVSVILKFPDERIALFDCSFRMVLRQFYEVVGTSGKIDVPASFVPGKSDVVVYVTKDNTREEINISGEDQYLLEVEHFSDCVLAGGELKYPGENGLSNMRVIEGVYKSIKESAPVRL